MIVDRDSIEFSLGLLGRFDTFLPDLGPSPVQVAKLRGKVRERATSGNTVPPPTW